MTANDLIALALKDLLVLAAGEVPTADEANDALTILNLMMDQWNAERLMIFSDVMNEFPLTVGKQVYTLGPGGDFNVPRPAYITRVGIVSLNNPSQPLELHVEYLTVQQWQEVPVKLISSTLPLQVYDDQAFPLRNLNFRYIPQIPVNVRIYSWAALSSFVDLVTDYTFPPGYLQALRYNLAIELAAPFGAPLPPTVVQQAAITKGLVKSINTPMIDLKSDTAIIGDASAKRLYNWLVDMPVAR